MASILLRDREVQLLSFDLLELDGVGLRGKPLEQGLITDLPNSSAVLFVDSTGER